MIRYGVDGDFFTKLDSLVDETITEYTTNGNPNDEGIGMESFDEFPRIINSKYLEGQDYKLKVTRRSPLKSEMVSEILHMHVLGREILYMHVFGRLGFTHSNFPDFS